jgi:hypothetical protein
VDLDQDGNFDILSGSYSRMEESMAGLFQVLWGQAGGKFKKAEALKGGDGKDLIIPVNSKPGEGDDWTNNICTRPFAVDWDTDGDLDLVVGNFPGTFYLFKGEGKGKFDPAPEQIKTGDQPLKIEGHHSDPFVIDWDGDGDLDILSGSSGGGVAQWAENTAGKGKLPELKPFTSLIAAVPQRDVGRLNILRDEDIKGPQSDTRIWVDDYNADGKLDIFVGDLVNLVSPAGNLTEQEMNEKFDRWNKELSEVSVSLNASASGETRDEKEQAAAREKFQKLYSSRSEFMKEDRTGFVWVYLQK